MPGPLLDLLRFERLLEEASASSSSSCAMACAVPTPLRERDDGSAGLMISPRWLATGCSIPTTKWDRTGTAGRAPAARASPTRVYATGGSLIPELDVSAMLPPLPSEAVIGGDIPVWSVGPNAILATEMLVERIRLITCRLQQILYFLQGSKLSKARANRACVVLVGIRTLTELFTETLAGQ